MNDLRVNIDKKMNFLQHVYIGWQGFCDAGVYQNTVIQVQRFIHSEISLHVFGSSEAGVRQLCMKPML
jgi:hypothetical protein